MSAGRKSHLLLGLGGLAIVLLLAAVFTLGSLTLPFEPRQWDQVLVTQFCMRSPHSSWRRFLFSA